MGVLDEMKEVADLIKKVGDIELYRKIVKLESDVMDLTRANRGLEGRVEELTRMLNVKKNLVHSQGNYYVVEGDKKDGPYCTICWDRDSKLVGMKPSRTLGPVCEYCRTHRR